jgi:hypothetical protein
MKRFAAGFRALPDEAQQRVSQHNVWAFRLEKVDVKYVTRR